MLGIIVKIKSKSRYIIAFISIFCFFFVLSNIINPINAGLGPGVRDSKVQEFANANAGAYLSIGFYGVFPEVDALGNVQNVVRFVEAEIPLTVDPVIENPVQQDPNNPLIEADTGTSALSVFNPMENLLTEQSSFVDNLFKIGQVVPASGSFYWIDNYENGTQMTPLANRPTIAFDTDWHYQKRYTCTVPSPMQFATMIAESVSGTVLNMTYANTRVLTGLGGTCPQTVTQSYGVPCEIQNDTSNMMINLVPLSESDKMQAAKYEKMGYARESDYHSYTVNVKGLETDEYSTNLFLGSYIITGAIPSLYTTVSLAEGSKRANYYTGLELVQRVAEADMEAQGPAITIPIEALFAFYCLGYGSGQQSQGDEIDRAFTKGLYEGYEQGYLAALSEQKLMFQLWLSEQKPNLNLSDWQYEQITNGFTDVNNVLKENHTNPYNVSGWIPPGMTPSDEKNLPYYMPSTVSINHVLTIGLVVGGIIIIIIIGAGYYLYTRRKKAQVGTKGQKRKLEASVTA